MNLRHQDPAGDRPCAGHDVRAAGARQRSLFRWRGLVVSTGGGVHDLRAGWNHAGEAPGYGPEHLLEESTDPFGSPALGSRDLAARAVAARAGAADLAHVAPNLQLRGLAGAGARRRSRRPMLGEPAQVRSPSSLDRSATLRWLVGAAGCLGIFWVVSHFTDRLRRLYLVWGSVVAAFLLNGAFGLVQIAGQSDGLFGIFLPGRSAAWAPSLDDLLERARRPRPCDGCPTLRPRQVLIRRLERIALVPDRPFLFGTMMGGPGGFLALGSLALPLALAILLHLISPRGVARASRSRLAPHGTRQAWSCLLMIMLVIVRVPGRHDVRPLVQLAVWRGLIGGRLPCLAARRVAWSSIALTMLLLSSLGLGATLVAAWPKIVGRAATGRTAVLGMPPGSSGPKACRSSSNSR